MVRERERELKGRVPVASHAAAGGGQSNHAEVPRFNLCVCERERRERRERGQQRMGHPRLNQREREMETRAAAAPLQQRMGQITRRVARLLRRRKRTPVEAAVAYSAAGMRSTKLLVLNQQK